jgi:hypothetical protein
VPTGAGGRAGERAWLTCIASCGASRVWTAKLNGPFVPLAVGAHVIAWATMGGPYEGAAMNPARAFGPDVALANLSTWWIYLLGPSIGAVIAVRVAYVLRGPAEAGEATAAEGTPLHRGIAGRKTSVPTAHTPQ